MTPAQVKTVNDVCATIQVTAVLAVAVVLFMKVVTTK